MRMIFTTAIAASVVTGRADAQGQLEFPTVLFVHGTCERLVTPDGDQSEDCNKVLGLASYSNGRHSLWFSVPKKSLIAFSGIDENAEGNTEILQLDLLTVASESSGTTPRGGTGSCTYSDPWKGRAHFSCSGSTDDGKFAAEFTTDGKPPENPLDK